MGNLLMPGGSSDCAVKSKASGSLILPPLLETNAHTTRYWQCDETHGAVLFGDGSCYIGGLENSIRKNFGILLLTDGTLYEGNWMNDALVGECVVTSPEGVRSTCVSTNGFLSDCKLIGRTFRTQNVSHHVVLPTISSMTHSRPFSHRSSTLVSTHNSPGHSTPQLYTSTSSSVYVPRPPSDPEVWLIPYEQIKLGPLLSRSSCGQCPKTYKGTWLGKEVVVKCYDFSPKMYQDVLPRIMELLSRLAKIRHANICLFMAASLTTNILVEKNFEESSSKHPLLETNPHIASNCRLCIITEYVSNGSLLQSNRQTAFSAQSVLHIAKGISVGCAYLRKQGFAHKNLKPSNVLIDGVIEVKLTDYFVKEFNELFHSGKVSRCVRLMDKNSIRYLPPESLRATTSLFQPFGIDSNSDVYSFGMILHEMVSSRIPFVQLSVAQIRLMVGFGGYREPIICPGTLSGLTQIIERTTEQEPSSRTTFERLIVALSAMYATANSAAEDALITFVSGR